jgi:hypothetical protein
MTNHACVAGVNLGGWLSQYRAATREHFDTFITEGDIEQIANWGVDHVRVPVDYPVFEDDAAPGAYKEEGLQYLDQALEWCRQRGLGMVIDLHHAPGYSFGTLQQNTLFDDPQMQARFVAIWEMLTRRYRSEGDWLQLELLNEVVEPTSERWNALAHRTIAAIRAIDARRTIVYGGNHYNAIEQLAQIDVLPGDEHIIYNFHFYKPGLLTHQRAPWMPFLRDLPLSEPVDYPGDYSYLKEILEQIPEAQRPQPDVPLGVMDRSTLETLVQPAADFQARTGKPLYCGEFGVIQYASIDSRINWHRDLVAILMGLGIGRAVWTYKEMSFPLVDYSGRVVSEELVRAISRH